MAFLTNNLQDRLLFAIPKKGRLYEKSLELLAGADIQFTRSHRLDVALVTNHPIALVFLPASDIPRFVAHGSVDLGITGQDMVAESLLSDQIKELLPLGFGKCSLQVQVPVNSGINDVKQLCGRKVVTSFEELTGKLFTELDEQTLSKEEREKGSKTGVEYVGGSVEAACALGLADGIVDLVESGETMRAAGLMPIHTLMTSQAVLIRSSPELESSTSKSPIKFTSLSSHLPLLKRIISRLEGVLTASRYVFCEYNVSRTRLAEATKITPGQQSATISPLEAEGWVAVRAMVRKEGVASIMDELQEIGATDILILTISNCRV